MITDLLLDINIIVDICGKRKPHFSDSIFAFDIARGKDILDATENIVPFLFVLGRQVDVGDFEHGLFSFWHRRRG